MQPSKGCKWMLWDSDRRHMEQRKLGQITRLKQYRIAVETKAP